MASQITLNIYLLKKGFSPFDEIDLGGFNPVFDIPVSREHKSILYFKSSGGEPDWLSGLKTLSSFTGDVGSSQSPQALLFVRSGQRWFVISFGHAWQKVSSANIVSDFGTRCVLNMADPNSLVSIRRDRIASASIQAIEQIPDTDDIQRFGLDVEQDMLRGVKARVDDSFRFGSSVVGGESFKGTIDLESDSIVSFCRRALNIYGWKNIKSNFDWFDKISPAPENKIVDLERRLAKALSLRVRSISFTIPVFLAWDEYDTFSFRKSKRGHQPVSEPLDPIHWRNAHVQGAVRPADIEREFIYAYKLGVSHLVTKWPLRKCINATIKLGSELYVTQSGSWYKVAKDFLRQVENDINAIAVDTKKFPALKKAENEGEYNKRVGEDFKSRFSYLDKQNVYVTGRSYIECCDLLRFDGAMVCVKPWGGKSQHLSHLFQQAIVSGQLISSHPPFITGVAEEITSPGFKAIWNRESSKPSGAVFVLAIIRGVPKDRLPFFAQVSLVSCVRTLRQMRFSVKYSLIT